MDSGGFEVDCKACQGVCACGEGESASVFVEDFADEQQADAVAVDFCGKEGAEEHFCSFRVNAGAVVCHGQCGRRSGGAYRYLSVGTDTFG